MVSDWEIQKLDETLEPVDIYVGIPMDQETYGSEPVIQVNDKFIQPKQLRQFINEEVAKLPITKRSKSNLIVSMKVDEEVNMGVIIDIKQELRKIPTKVNFAAEII